MITLKSILLSFTSGFDKLGWKYFLIYVVTNVTNAIVSYFLFPETKHRSLEEIVSCGSLNRADNYTEGAFEFGRGCYLEIPTFAFTKPRARPWRTTTPTPRLMDPDTTRRRLNPRRYHTMMNR
jgi:hypothetical protein